MKTNNIKGLILGFLLYVIFFPMNLVKAAYDSSKFVISEKIISTTVVEPNLKTLKPIDTTVNNTTQSSIDSAEVEYIKKRICEVFGKECNNALIIAQHESGFTNHKVSKTKDYGLFQLNCRWQGRRVGGNCNLFFDMETNLRIAKQIFDEQGWNPWTTKIYLK